MSTQSPWQRCWYGRLRPWVGLGALLLLWTTALRVRADPPRYVLSWRAPPACPDSAEVRAWVDRHLAGRAGAPGRGQLQVRVRVAPERGGYAARVTLVSSEGRHTRTLRDHDCAVAAEAVAFIVARAIDPQVGLIAKPPAGAHTGDPGAGSPPPGPPSSSARTGASEAEPEPSATGPADGDASEPPGTPPRRLRPRMRITRVRARSLAFAVDLEAIGMAAPLPKPSGGVLGRLWLRVGSHFALGAGAGYLVPVREGLPGDPSAKVRFDRPFGLVSFCATGDVRPTLAVGGCGSLQVGATRADSSDLSDGVDRNLPDALATLGLLVVRRFAGPLALRSELDLVLPLMRSRFELDEGELVHQTDAVGWFVSLGTEVQFD